MQCTRLGLLLVCPILYLVYLLIWFLLQKKVYSSWPSFCALLPILPANIKTKMYADYTLKLKVQAPKEKIAKSKEHFNGQY